MRQVSDRGGTVVRAWRGWGLLLAWVPLLALAQQGDWVDNPFDVGPPQLPRQVVLDCQADTQHTPAECLALSGFPSDPEPIPHAACDLRSCLTIPAKAMKEVTQTVGGYDIRLYYSTLFTLAPPTAAAGEGGGDWGLKAASELDLSNLRNIIKHMVATSLPENTCQAEHRLENPEESADGDTYTYTVTVRTDVRDCYQVACFPNVTEWCDGPIYDMGTLHNKIVVRLRVHLEGSKLKGEASSEFIEGEVPPDVLGLFNLEDFFNFITGHLFRSGNQEDYRRQIDAAMRTAMDATLQMAANPLEARVGTPAMAAYRLQVGEPRLEMVNGRLYVFVASSGVIPEPLVCEARQALIEYNDYQCPRGR